MKTRHDYDPKVSIPSALEPGFAHIWSADLQKVASRLKREHLFWSDAKIGRLIREYRKFLSLVLLSDSEIAMCSESVDEVWHTHVLFTRDYEEFCRTAFGGFLHHEPAGEEGSSSSHSTTDFFAAYARVFGEPDGVWFGPWWMQCLRRISLSPKLCTASGTAKLCTASGPVAASARLCTASGSLARA